MRKVSYAHKSDPYGTRFIDFEGKCPSWAVDVQPYEDRPYVELGDENSVIETLVRELARYVTPPYTFTGEDINRAYVFLQAVREEYMIGEVRKNGSD